ncbi:hypothetical protein Syun_006225 [Stephania yunnanensis]|uniref:Uncharacterized protein n=1 Tax=Stephania yunnanensis TaxID=152371 RepID=A0AAP0KZK4_9MAGN
MLIHEENKECNSLVPSLLLKQSKNMLSSTPAFGFLGQFFFSLLRCAFKEVNATTIFSTLKIHQDLESEDSRRSLWWFLGDQERVQFEGGVLQDLGVTIQRIVVVGMPLVTNRSWFLSMNSELYISFNLTTSARGSQSLLRVEGSQLLLKKLVFEIEEEVQKSTRGLQSLLRKEVDFRDKRCAAVLADISSSTLVHEGVAVAPEGKKLIFEIEEEVQQSTRGLQSLLRKEVDFRDRRRGAAVLAAISSSTLVHEGVAVALKGKKLIFEIEEEVHEGVAVAPEGEGSHLLLKKLIFEIEEEVHEGVAVSPEGEGSQLLLKMLIFEIEELMQQVVVAPQGEGSKLLLKKLIFEIEELVQKSTRGLQSLLRKEVDFRDRRRGAAVLAAISSSTLVDEGVAVAPEGILIEVDEGVAVAPEGGHSLLLKKLIFEIEEEVQQTAKEREEDQKIRWKLMKLWTELFKFAYYLQGFFHFLFRVFAGAFDNFIEHDTCELKKQFPYHIDE